MTDAEVICSFMEPDAPASGGRPNIDVLSKFSPEGWWRYHLLACNWKRPILDSCAKVEQLGRLREVQERLTEGQWDEYRGWFMVEHQMDGHKVPFGTYLLHATPEQKIRALAAVLRTPEVTK